MPGIKELAEELQERLTKKMVAEATPIIDATIEQIVRVAKREDLSLEERQASIAELQQAITAPFVLGGVQAAQASRMSLSTYLALVGEGWEAVRDGVLGQVTEEMLRREVDRTAP